jgi:protein-S-isoprenylcysteine O-methyltransferase Ste14
MSNDTQVSSAKTRPPRPPSAVSTGVGMAGLVGVTIWMTFALTFDINPVRFWLADMFGNPEIATAGKLDGPWSAAMNVIFCGVPMVLWSVLVDRVHRNPTTGLDWDGPPKRVRDTLDTSVTKLAGLWATWAIIAGLYCVFRFYWRGNYVIAMDFYKMMAAPLFVMSIFYVLWIDTRLKEPKDGAWHLGALLMGTDGWDKEAIYAHFRSWAVKGFFLAFMISIVPPNFESVVGANFTEMARNPVAWIIWLVNLMFVLDVAFATVGYLLTMKPLDAHIRSATPYAAGWAAALICYPPFILMGDNGPLNYHPGTAEWSYWLADYPVLIYAVGAVLVILTGIYAWATIVFGLRFSNLTDRGILTNGPYAFTKHPAYLSKNAFWWLSAMPFLATTGSLTDVIRNTAILAMVSGVYYWRAKTEERHLSANVEYRDYAAWMADYGPITRLLTPKNWPSAKRANAPMLEATPAE